MTGARHARAWLAAFAFVAVAALLLALSFVGRWERNRNARNENSRMKAVYELATQQGLISPLLDKYRLADRFDCLDYHPADRPQDTTAYEICFDPDGRLVQTIDRSSGTPRFASLLEQPSLATSRVPVPRLMALFRRLGVLEDPHLAGVDPHTTVLPTLSYDIGALPFPRPPKS